MKLGRIVSVVFVLVLALWLPGQAIAQATYIGASVNQQTNEFVIACIMFSGPADPTWQPQAAGDEILGLASYVIDLETTGTLQLANVVNVSPVDGLAGFSQYRFAVPMGSYWRAAAFQRTIFGDPTVIYNGVGTTFGPTWSWPVQLVRGNYTGSGTLSIGVPVIVIRDAEGNIIREMTSVGVLYGPPAGWEGDPRKVEALKPSDVLTFPATIP